MPTSIKSAFFGLGAIAIGLVLWALPSPVSRVQKNVRDHLFDPDSAQFSGVTHNSLNGVGCGYINSKNRLGGYSGKTHFILQSDGKLQFFPTTNIEADEVAYVKMMREVCEH